MNGHNILKPRNLNVLKHRYDASFYEAIATIMALRQTYIQDRFIFVKGEDMIPIIKGLGARDIDFELLKSISDQTGADPTLNYRAASFGRYCIDSEKRNIRRPEQQPYTLTIQEDYKRHDSGMPRDFMETPADMQENAVVQALMVFKALVFQDVSITPRDRLDYSSRSWVCMKFNGRVLTDSAGGIFGEPGLEGVHSDGSDHTMSVLWGCDNMRPESAVTFLHDNRETTGASVSEVEPTLIKARVQHRHFLDTLVFVDHDYKHSVMSLRQLCPSLIARRDVLVAFTRRPKMESHISGYCDSIVLHLKSPMQIPLQLP
ncbi:2OG-Fe dioxygenase-domain-containing protein [Aspergillus bertholletiae]|uniref:2OG-Fe dioxygenase-domain-containing protein n=1 Tax=Aspergillus bertholletiae TaxID=1226010 RepID=A0A5N7BEK9_9EURO|nr:2OG-Fe dioxygenase-domain-containing protein [Aspergillus bertholletiae]